MFILAHSKRSMKILVDIGNTSAKLVVSDNGDFVHFEHKSEPWRDLLRRLAVSYKLDEAVVSTVVGDDLELVEALRDLSVPCRYISCDTPCRSKTLQGIPETYGADRLAADYGAVAQDLNSTILVIDAGTCITYDLISSDGRFLGGVISPGIQLRLNAMHDYTAKLPLVKAVKEAPLLSDNTIGNLMSGAVNGARMEIAGFVSKLSETYADLHVFVTGGDGLDLSADVQCKVTYDPYLVFKGLDSI